MKRDPDYKSTEIIVVSSVHDFCREMNWLLKVRTVPILVSVIPLLLYSQARSPRTLRSVSETMLTLTQTTSCPLYAQVNTLSTEVWAPLGSSSPEEVWGNVTDYTVHDYNGLPPLSV